MNQIVIENPNIEMNELKQLLVTVIEENKRLQVNTISLSLPLITIITIIIIIIIRNIIDKMKINIRKK